MKKNLLICSALLAVKNIIIYSLKRTELNKNSIIEIAIIEIGKL